MENKVKQQSGTGLLVTGDLIFCTKITGTAAALGLKIQVVGSPDAASAQIQTARPGCVMLDLGLASLTPERIGEIVRAARGTSVIAFGSHVDTARLKEARDAGCTEVMSRSRLSSELPSILLQYLTSTPGG